MAFDCMTHPIVTELITQSSENRIANAAMLNVNANPTIIARIPIIILNAVNPLNINTIPRNTKLNPIRTVNATELKIGQIIKINPKIMANIPDA